MKKQDKEKLRQADVAQLQKKLDSLAVDLVKTQNQLKLGKLTNLKSAKNIRYQIAFIKTIIREKELANQSETA